MVCNIFNYYSWYFSEPNILGQIGNFSSRIGKKTYFLALGMGPNFGPKFRRSRALKKNSPSTVPVAVGKITFKLWNSWGVWCTFIYSTIFINASCLYDFLYFLSERRGFFRWVFFGGRVIAAVNKRWGGGGWAQIIFLGSWLWVEGAQYIIPVMVRKYSLICSLCFKVVLSCDVLDVNLVTGF